MHLIAELGTLGSKCRAHFFFYLGRQDWQTFSISVLLPSVCIWTESGRRRWVQWSIKRSITCICYSPILKLRKTQARADPCCPPGKIDSMTNPPLSQLFISSIFISETEQKLSSVSNQFHVYHTSLCSASLSYSLNLYFVFSFFFFRGLPLHDICYLHSRGKRITVARSRVTLRVSQDALCCVIKILPKGFSSGQQHLAPAYAQVIQL